MFGKNSKQFDTKPRRTEAWPDVALAAIVSSKNQKDVGEYMKSFIEALERNTAWLNEVVEKQTDFKCALLVGAGPNRFQLQNIIYPSDEENMKFEVELRDSDDYDKIALTALIKLRNFELDRLLNYIKTIGNSTFKEDLFKLKSMGVTFAVLRPISDKLYRICTRIAIEDMKAPKRRREDKSISRIFKKAKRALV